MLNLCARRPATRGRPSLGSRGRTAERALAGNAAPRAFAQRRLIEAVAAGPPGARIRPGTRARGSATAGASRRAPRDVALRLCSPSMLEFQKLAPEAVVEVRASLLSAAPATPAAAPPGGARADTSPAVHALVDAVFSFRRGSPWPSGRTRASAPARAPARHAHAAARMTRDARVCSVRARRLARANAASNLCSPSAKRADASARTASATFSARFCFSATERSGAPNASRNASMETRFGVFDESAFSTSPANAANIFARSSGATATWNRSRTAKNSRSSRNPSPSTSKERNARRMGFPPSRNFSPILRRRRRSASRAESGFENDDAKTAIFSGRFSPLVVSARFDKSAPTESVESANGRFASAGREGCSSRRTRAVAGRRAPLFVPGPTSVAAHDSSGSAHSTNAASATRPSASRSSSLVTASTTSASEATLNDRRIAATVSPPIRPSRSTPATRRISRRAPSEDRAIDLVFSRRSSRTERRRPATEYTGTRTTREPRVPRPSPPRFASRAASAGENGSSSERSDVIESPARFGEIARFELANDSSAASASASKRSVFLLGTESSRARGGSAKEDSRRSAPGTTKSQPDASSDF